MSIEINGTNNPQPHTATENTRAKPTQKEPASSADTGRSSTADTLSLTEQASQLQKLDANIGKVPVVDTQRVEQVRKAIADGSYEVNPDKIAQRLLTMEADLYGAPEPYADNTSAE